MTDAPTPASPDRESLSSKVVNDPFTSDFFSVLRGLPRRIWVAWHRDVVAPIDHPPILDHVAQDSVWTMRYGFMVIVSCGIAILGLLLSSPAVVIGAMLISPLMGPIVALGFSLVLLDYREMRNAIITLGTGALLAIATSFLIVKLSPLTSPTPEILARTRPQLFDLLVAVFSAMAGGYAVIKQRGETIVGVAIATALMPPLAVVGYGLAVGNWTIFGGALGLFMTNLLAIALTVSVMAKLFGFGTHLTPRTGFWQTVAIVAMFAGASIPLAMSLRQIAWETVASTVIRADIQRHFGKERTRITDFTIDYANPTAIAVEAVILTDTYREGAGRALGERLSARLQRPVTVTLDQVLRGSAQARQDAGLRQAEAAMRSFLQLRETESKNSAQAGQIQQVITLALGVPVEAMLVDRVAQRLRVPVGIGVASVGELRRLETRLQSHFSDWTVEIVPPVGVPLMIRFPAGSAELSADDSALKNSLWALKRWHAGAVTVTGYASDATDGRPATARRLAADRAKAVIATLSAAGLDVTEGRPDDTGTQRAVAVEQGAARLRVAVIEPASTAPLQ